MKKTAKYMLFAAVMFAGTAAFAGGPPRHHRTNDGLRLAAGIVNLVAKTVAPAPHYRTQVYCRPAPPPPPPRKVGRPGRIEHRRPAPPPRKAAVKPAGRHR